MARLQTVLAISLLCLSVSPYSHAQDLPEVDVDALMEQVNTLADKLRTEAQRLIDEEGAEKAIVRLANEAIGDETVAFARLNLAAVVAVRAGDEETAVAIIEAIPAASDNELPFALARHALAIASDAQEVRSASADDLVWQGGQGQAPGADLIRFAPLLAALMQMAPDSLDVATSLNNIGLVLCDRGELDAALGYLQRSLAIMERLAPDSLPLAAPLDNIGTVFRDCGDLDAALDCHQRARAILERLAPDSLDLARSLGNIGVTLLDRDDLDGALEHLQRALEIEERLAPDSLDLAGSLGNIGVVHIERGDLAAAIEHLQRALAIHERLAPDSLNVADLLDNTDLASASRVCLVTP